MLTMAIPDNAVRSANAITEELLDMTITKLRNVCCSTQM